jgi:hypothetical protein
VITSAGQDRLRALALANEVRRARANARRRIANSELSASEVLLAPPPELESLALIDLLRCQRGWGTVRARRFIAGHELSERKPLGTLTDRQRRLLAASLGRRGPGLLGSAVEVNAKTLRPPEGVSLKLAVLTDTRKSDAAAGGHSGAAAAAIASSARSPCSSMRQPAA